MNTAYKGIDYGLGQSNVDRQTGIRYGVISQNELQSYWFDTCESDYGEPTCPKCGNEAKTAKGRYDRYEHAKHECGDFVCHACKYVFGSESAYGDSPVAFYFDDGRTVARQSGDDGDIFVTKSPYFTFAQYCSPCAPGACYLMNWLDGDQNCETNKAYCFGHDWFDGGKAPYPVYSVETGELIQPETT